LKALFTPLPQYADIPACLQSREALTLTDQMTRALLGAAKRSTTIVRPGIENKGLTQPESPDHCRIELKAESRSSSYCRH
ncbi:hypothetical protein, partial [Sutterella sp.]|uniref:hypothetical protein n=2 Tax=Sutterella TaxID=40544 RepID=UPI0028515D0D